MDKVELSPRSKILISAYLFAIFDQQLLVLLAALSLAKCLAKLAYRLRAVALQAAIERHLVLRAIVEPLDPEGRQPLAAAPPRHHIQELFDRVLHAAGVGPVRLVDGHP